MYERNCLICILFRIVRARRCCFCILLSFISCSQLVYRRMLGFSTVYSTLCSLNMTTFLSHIADIPSCILCKWVRAHGDSSNSISVTWSRFGTSFYRIWKFVAMFTRACFLDPVLSPLNPAYTRPPYISRTRFDVVLTAMRRSFKWPFIRLSHKNTVCIFFLSMCYMHCFILLLLDFITWVIFGNQ